MSQKMPGLELPQMPAIPQLSLQRPLLPPSSDYCEGKRGFEEAVSMLLGFHLHLKVSNLQVLGAVEGRDASSSGKNESKTPGEEAKKPSNRCL